MEKMCSAPVKLLLLHYNRAALHNFNSSKILFYLILRLSEAH